MRIGISGIGFVGSAMYESFKMKKINEIILYDKYKNIGEFNNLLNTDILFLTLPTEYNEEIKGYNLEPIKETINLLKNNNYNGLVVIKSTVEPNTTNILETNSGLDIVHNPEFLTARTAIKDFNEQTHIVLGKGNLCNQNKFNDLVNFYKTNYPNAEISICNSIESEMMKLTANTFYAVKVQYFTEIYLMCKSNNVEYNNIRNLILKNGWINPMHTLIPGPDGNISYGGACLPKDSKTLSNYLEKNNLPNSVIKYTTIERDLLRN